MKKEKFQEAFEQLFQPMIEKCVDRALSERKESGATIENPEKWLTISQACKEFGCTQHTLRRAMLKLELPYYQPDKRTYLKRIDVFNYLEKLRIRANDEGTEYSFLNE